MTETYLAFVRDARRVLPVLCGTTVLHPDVVRKGHQAVQPGHQFAKGIHPASAYLVRLRHSILNPDWLALISPPHQQSLGHGIDVLGSGFVETSLRVLQCGCLASHKTSLREGDADPAFPSVT
jgi:hypothetical protein